MLALLDFGLGNLKSIQNGFRHLGHEAVITCDSQVIRDADGLIIPGVGAFKDGMDRLRRHRLIPVIEEALSQAKPILGICLGLQLLFSESEEFGRHRGLGMMEGTVKTFTGTLKIPHMGWNTVHITRRIPLIEGIGEGEYFYFVHSFFAVPDKGEIVAGETEYGITFPSVVEKGTLMATQFHPEKSSHAGLRILDNFARMAARRS